MTTRVKLQLTSDVEDVPNFLSHCLSEVIENLNNSVKVCEQLSRLLKSTDINNKDSLKELVSYIDTSRFQMIKADLRLNDVGSIVTSLVSFDESQVQDPEVSDTEEQTKSVE